MKPNFYLNRSLNYINLFDKETGLMRPKNQNGTFQKDFNPFRWGDHFTEGNSWQYTWFVPHDVEGLKKLLGGQTDFFLKVDSIFSLPQIYDISYYKRGIIHLIREMQNEDMGQYAHLNEPMHHVPYIFAFGQPWKTQYRVREIMEKLYAAEPDGYCGDEDNGQMSAWYVFSAMGFYPFCPVSNQYVLGSPLFKDIVISLPNKKTINIKADNNGKGNMYVDKILFNNKEYAKNYIQFSDIKNGAKIIFNMLDKPNVNRGTSVTAFPLSISKQE